MQYRQNSGEQFRQVVGRKQLSEEPFRRSRLQEELFVARMESLQSQLDELIGLSVAADREYEKIIASPAHEQDSARVFALECELNAARVESGAVLAEIKMVRARMKARSR